MSFGKYVFPIAFGTAGSVIGIYFKSISVPAGVYCCADADGVVK